MKYSTLILHISLYISRKFHQDIRSGLDFLEFALFSFFVKMHMCTFRDIHNVKGGPFSEMRAFTIV